MEALEITRSTFEDARNFLDAASELYREDLSDIVPYPGQPEEYYIQLIDGDTGKRNGIYDLNTPFQKPAITFNADIRLTEVQNKKTEERYRFYELRFTEHADPSTPCYWNFLNALERHEDVFDRPEKETFVLQL